VQDSFHRFQTAIGALLSDEEAGVAPSLRLRRFDEPELGLLRLSSWLFSLNRESSKEAIEFLRRVVPTGSYAAYDDHVRLVSNLRTYFQHHLSESQRDSKIREDAREFLDIRGTHGEDQILWNSALDGLVADFVSSIEIIARSLEDLISDPDLADLTKASWAIYRAKAVPPHEADRIVEQVATQLGLEHIDPRAFREKHFSTWRRQLDLLSDETDPREYLAGMVERALLNVLKDVPLPVSGADIIDSFGIPPGPRIGEILQAVKISHADAPKSKQVLLEEVADRFGLTLYE
jgi:hypothetical protein